MSGAPGGAAARSIRQRAVVDHVLGHGTASMADLVALTGRSLMTVHRDVDELAAHGVLRKFRGGVSALPTSVFESSSEFRLLREPQAKKSLAALAVEFVEPGMSLILDDSTTVYALAQLLGDVGPLTVITNFRPTIDLLVDQPEIRLICLGGHYSRPHDSYIGPPDLSGLQSYAVDIVFQSTSTMDATMTYHQEQDVVVMKRAMLTAGRRRVLLMDASKVGHTSLHRYAPVDAYTDIVLTADSDPELTSKIGEQSRLHLALPA